MSSSEDEEHFLPYLNVVRARNGQPPIVRTRTVRDQDAPQIADRGRRRGRPLREQGQPAEAASQQLPRRIQGCLVYSTPDHRTGQT